MGRSDAQNIPYRDDPDAVSLHTTPEGVQYTDDVPENFEESSPPPTYDEVTDHVRDAEDFSLLSGLEGDRLAGTNDPECHFSSFSTTQNLFQKKRKTRIAGEHVRIQYSAADTDPEVLQQWIEYMSRTAPSPYIVIVGTHSERQCDRDGKEKRVEVTDFRLCISTRNCLGPDFRAHDASTMDLRTADNGDKTWRGTVFKMRAPGVNGDLEVGEAKPTLKEWCHRYCASPSKTRIFRLTRTVVGFNEEYVRERLVGLVRSTNYKGHLDISFPVANRAVDIYSKSVLNDWRLNPWVCWLFYLTFLWIFSWPVLYFTTKRYNIVKAEWAFSRADARGVRKYTTISEEQWIDKFGPAVRQLALDRYSGLVGYDILNQVLARPEAPNPMPVELRNAAGAAVSAIRGGTNVGSQVNNVLRLAGGFHDEIGWGRDT